MPGAETARAIKGARPRPAGSEDAGAEHGASAVTCGGSKEPVCDPGFYSYTSDIYIVSYILYKKYKLNFDDIEFFTLLRL